MEWKELGAGLLDNLRISRALAGSGTEGVRIAQGFCLGQRHAVFRVGKGACAFLKTSLPRRWRVRGGLWELEKSFVADLSQELSCETD
jgi:hypothetical protein